MTPILWRLFSESIDNYTMNRQDEQQKNAMFPPLKSSPPFSIMALYCLFIVLKCHIALLTLAHVLAMILKVWLYFPFLSYVPLKYLNTFVYLWLIISAVFSFWFLTTYMLSDIAQCSTYITSILFHLFTYLQV